MATNPHLAQTVTTDVGYTLASAGLGWALVEVLNRTTPLRPPWWLGVGVGAALGSAAKWSKER